MDQGLTLQIEGHHPLVHHQGQQLSRLMGSALELVGHRAVVPENGRSIWTNPQFITK